MATETETVHKEHEMEHPRQMHHFDTMDQQKDASGLGGGRTTGSERLITLPPKNVNSVMSTFCSAAPF